MYEKILIVDDEEDIVSFIKDSLISEGYTILTASNGNDAIEMAKQRPDLILLDVMMPDIDGYNVCKAIRDVIPCPIIFISAKQGEKDIISGLAIGGDDYITKPFRMGELKVRIQAHLRREKRAITLFNRTLLHFGEVAIDIKGREIYFKDQHISMTKREFDIIEMLSLHPGQVFSREQIYDSIWGYEAVGDSSNIVEHIKKIRSKIHAFDPNTEYISTVWGIGYKWVRLN